MLTEIFALAMKINIRATRVESIYSIVKQNSTVRMLYPRLINLSPEALFFFLLKKGK
jgi:hypothetical protein